VKRKFIVSENNPRRRQTIAAVGYSWFGAVQTIAAVGYSWFGAVPSIVQGEILTARSVQLGLGDEPRSNGLVLFDTLRSLKFQNHKQESRREKNTVEGLRFVLVLVPI